VEHVGSFLTKYISKEQKPIGGNTYYISKNLRKLMEPVGQISYHASLDDANEITQDALVSQEAKGTMIRDLGGYVSGWVSNADGLAEKIKRETENLDNEAKNIDQTGIDNP